MNSPFSTPKLVLPGEDPHEFAALIREYVDRYQPLGAVEYYLVETLIQCDWIRRRLFRDETEILSAIPRPGNRNVMQLCDAYGSKDVQRAFDKIVRRQFSLERSYFRALRELQREQKERRASEQDADTEPAQTTQTQAATATAAAAHTHTRSAKAAAGHPLAFGFQNATRRPPLTTSPADRPVTVIDLGKGHAPEGLVFVG